MIFYRFQLHFVGKSPLTGQDVFTLEIAVHHQYHSSIVRHLPHDNRQSIQPGKFSSIQLDLNPFTLVGATTRSGLLTAPLRARFGINLHLEYYDAEVLSRIVERSAHILSVPIEHDAAMEIAGRSRGTPRIANALLRRVRDFAQVRGTGRVDMAIARYALEALNIDRYGLDEIDNKILLTIIDKFKGGPVGITTIATAIGEDAGTVEEVYEPFLIKEGFIKRTPRGREVTDMAYKHLGRSRFTADLQGSLFDD